MYSPLFGFPRRLGFSSIIGDPIVYDELDTGFVERMIELTSQQVHLPTLLGEIVGQEAGEIVLAARRSPFRTMPVHPIPLSPRSAISGLCAVALGGDWLLFGFDGFG
jgi:hypothetical protein